MVHTIGETILRAPTEASVRRRAGIGALVAVVLMLMLLLDACILERPNGVTIDNDLRDPVEIVYLKDGGMSGGRLEPGVTKIFTFDLYQWGKTDKESCTVADIVAKSADGTVIARIPPPRCIGSTVDLSSWLAP